MRERIGKIKWQTKRLTSESKANEMKLPPMIFMPIYIYKIIPNLPTLNSNPKSFNRFQQRQPSIAFPLKIVKKPELRS